MRKTFTFTLLLICTTMLFAQQKNKVQMADAKEKANDYAYYALTADLSHLTKSEQKLIPIFIEIADIMDGLFWKQTYGDKEELMKQITDPYEKDYAIINYGPWDRLDGNRSFVKGFGAKPDVCKYYPLDMSQKEFDACKDPNKNSLYTVLRRNSKGELIVRWYHEEYKEEIGKVCELLEKAINITDDPEMKNYLIERKKAFETDDYFKSDLAWMDMKNSNIDFVVGPIENYDDKFMEAKASYEAFILVKDVKRSSQLSHFINLLPEIQKNLPCEPKYKTFVPGTSSDLNVYNAIYYAGDCNAGSKTIAINLPNDDRVQALKGARRLQLRNSMQAKFDKIMMPIGKIVLNPDQFKYLNFDAFFWNVTFHEVGHGLGIKETVNGKGSVDDALKTEKTSWEEAKADILGLYIVCYLIDNGEITNIKKEEAITTFITGLFRSVRFGSASSHGKANMMCYNVMKKEGAFTRDEKGIYTIDFHKAEKAVKYWAGLILKTQGEGDFEFARSFREKNGVMGPELEKDLNTINTAGIPRDIRFKQGLNQLDLKSTSKESSTKKN